MDVVVNLSKTIEPQPSSNIIDSSIIQKSAFDSQSEMKICNVSLKMGKLRRVKVIRWCKRYQILRWS